MNNNTIPRTPFSTPLSGSAKETEMRLRNIFSGPKKRPPVLFLILMFSACLLCGNLVSCQVAEAEGPKAEVWVDYLDSEEDLWDSSAEIEMPEYPGVTFRWTASGVTARDEAGEANLIHYGMPVWNVILCDLNGDGKRELCAAVSFGSGVIDEHIEVYDYAAKQWYILWDRMEYDYALSLEDGQLRVSQWEYQGGPPCQGEPVAVGRLALSSDNSQERDGTWFIAQAAELPQPEPAAGMSEGMAVDNWRDGFWFVLMGTGSFQSASDGERLDLHSLTRLFTWDPDITFQVESFTLCDLDGDSVPEAVLRLGDYMGYAVLRWEDGEVLGYGLGLRSFDQLKADGTFMYSNSASDWGIGRNTFNGKKSVLEEITYCEPAADYEIYMSHGQFISRNDFDLAVEQWEASAQPLWCELTEENIDAMLNAEGRFHVYELEDTESDDYKLTFVGQLADDEWAPGGELYSPIQIFDGDTLIQTITKDSPVQDEGFLFEGFLPLLRPDYRDVNFDGVPDLGLLCGGSYNGPVYWFLRNRETGQFEPGFYSSLELNVDDEKKILLDGWKDGLIGWDYWTYQYNDQGERVCIDHQRIENQAP